jgi:hypothetical protein
LAAEDFYKISFLRGRHVRHGADGGEDKDVSVHGASSGMGNDCRGVYFRSVVDESSRRSEPRVSALSGGDQRYHFRPRSFRQEIGTSARSINRRQRTRIPASLSFLCYNKIIL